MPYFQDHCTVRPGLPGHRKTRATKSGNEVELSNLCLLLNIHILPLELSSEVRASSMAGQSNILPYNLSRQWLGVRQCFSMDTP